MKDLEEMRQYDIKYGHFDMYVDDVNFTEEQYIMLRQNDVCRISDINPENANDAIFARLKQEAEYYKNILDIISDGKARVLDSGVRTYVDKILEYVHSDMNCLNKLTASDIAEGSPLEQMIIRHFLVRYNVEAIVDNNRTSEQIEEDMEMVKIEYNKFLNLIEKKRAVPVIKNNNIKTVKIS